MLKFNCRSGFSLVEVVLALGVISFCVLSLMALLPIGMDNFNQANKTSLSSQIAQQVTSELQQTDFQKLVSVDEGNQGQYKTEPIRYFDQNGTEQDESSTAVYHVNIRISPATDLPKGTESHVNEKMATITVQVAHNPSGRRLSMSDDKLWISSQAAPISTYSAIIAQNR